MGRHSTGMAYYFDLLRHLKALQHPQHEALFLLQFHGVTIEEMATLRREQIQWKRGGIEWSETSRPLSFLALDRRTVSCVKRADERMIWRATSRVEGESSLIQRNRPLLNSPYVFRPYWTRTDEAIAERWEPGALRASIEDAMYDEALQWPAVRFAGILHYLLATGADGKGGERDYVAMQRVAQRFPEFLDETGIREDAFSLWWTDVRQRLDSEKEQAMT